MKLSNIEWKYSKDEPIAPHQAVLLKVFNAYLRYPHVPESKDFTFLIPVAAALTETARDSVQRSLSLGESGAESSPNRPLSNVPDVKLAPLLNAVVLIAGCSFTLTLKEIKGDSAYSQRFKEEPSLIENTVGRQ